MIDFGIFGGIKSLSNKEVKCSSRFIFIVSANGHLEKDVDKNIRIKEIDIVVKDYKLAPKKYKNL